MSIGITERGDAALNLHEWIKAHDDKGVDFTIAITKAPHILLDNIKILPANLIIHATITGWGGTTVEPNVPLWSKEIRAYQELVRLLGPNKVVLRIDPIIPIKEGIEIAVTLSKYCMGRLRVSILDFYNHVRDRLHVKNAYVHDALAPFYGNSIHLPQYERAKILKLFPAAEICGEPGFTSVGCVSAYDYKALGLHPPLNQVIGKQRKDCACLSTKTELLTNKKQCLHGCVYCYWRN